LKVLKASSVIKDFIHEHDEEALKSLKLIKAKPSDDATKPFNFSLVFTFGPNEYFENTELSLKLHMENE